MDWIKGDYIDRAEGYYREDDDLVLDCLGSSSPNLIRVEGIRRFGKTSYLKRLERIAGKEETFGAGEIPDYNQVFFLDFMALRSAKKIDAIGADIEAAVEAARSPENDSRILILVDEINAALGTDAKPQPVDLFNQVVTAAASAGASGSVRVVVCEVSRMRDLLPASKLAKEIVARILEAPTHRIKGLEQKEIIALETQRGSLPPPDVEDSLRKYVGRHPLFLQHMCFAYHDDEITDIEDFEEYLASEASESIEITWEHLRATEQLLLKRIAYYSDTGTEAVPKELFTTGAGETGHSLLKDLQDFGLVEGTDDGRFYLGHGWILDHILRNGGGDPAEDPHPDLMRRWKRLFKDRHPRDKEVPSCVIHQLADLHISTSDSKGPHGFGNPVWHAYLNHLRKLAPLDQPHIIAVAGDLLLQDSDSANPRQQAVEYRDSLLMAKSQLEGLEKHMQRIHQDDQDRPRRVVVVPGDFDVEVYEESVAGTPDIKQSLGGFNSIFGSEGPAVEYFEDLSLVLVPLNSSWHEGLPPGQKSGWYPTLAEDQDATTTIERQQTRREWQERQRTRRESRLAVVHQASAADDTELRRLLGSHRTVEYGSLPADTRKSLKDAMDRAVPAGTEPKFRHTLRLALFHHHIEQLTRQTRVVDFEEGYLAKQTLAENGISLVLNGHAHRFYFFSEEIHLTDQKGKTAPLRSICCGTMNDRLVDGENTDQSHRPSFNEIRIEVKSLSGEERRKLDGKPWYRYDIQVTTYSFTGESFEADPGSGYRFPVIR